MSMPSFVPPRPTTYPNIEITADANIDNLARLGEASITGLLQQEGWMEHIEIAIEGELFVCTHCTSEARTLDYLCGNVRADAT